MANRGKTKYTDINGTTRDTPDLIAGIQIFLAVYDFKYLRTSINSTSNKHNEKLS